MFITSLNSHFFKRKCQNYQWSEIIHNDKPLRGATKNSYNLSNITYFLISAQSIEDTEPLHLTLEILLNRFGGKLWDR